MISKYSLSLIVAASCVVSMVNAADDYSASAASSAQRYTFSWPLDGSTLKPRGGTTKGPAVTLDQTPSEAWNKLQTAKSPLERDRQAILAMAGTYRVTFDFLEAIPYTQQDKPNAPYQSWGTEKVYVDIDKGKSISLVHILEMRIVQKDGSISDPMVTKHWRQDWQYEPSHIAEYRGRDQWQRRAVASAERKGAWLQAVYQVDESPRYASVGRWQHTPSFSTWVSGETWRPLPRREWSVRDDYQVLVGENRHTITPTGWIQEENNLKAVVTTERELDAAKPYLAREYGVARYERTRDADFAAADEYYQRTQNFWRDVRESWVDKFESEKKVTLRGPVDKLGLFMPLFSRADEIATEPSEASNDMKNKEVIRAALKGMTAK